VTARLRLLRRISLLLLLAWVGILGASFLRREIERRPPTGQVEIEEGGAKPGEQPVRVHKGFVYTDTVGAEPNFRVASDQTIEFASGWLELHDVVFTLYHAGGVAYGLTAKQARLNREKREAIATGDVRLSLGGGIAVSAASFALNGEKRLLESRGPATFAGEGLGGLAGGIVCNLADNTIDLIGGVSLAWHEAGEPAPSLVLLTPRAVYSRSLARIDFPDGLTILRGPLRVKGGSAQVQLHEAEGAIQSVVVSDAVEMSGQLEDGSSVSGRAGRVQVDVLETNRLRLEAEPAADLGWVLLLVHGTGTGWREVTTWRLEGEGTRQAWEWLDTQGLACLVDYPAEGDPRHLSADNAHVTFADGKPSTVTAVGDVRAEAEQQWAEGGQLALSLQSRTFTLKPAPGQRVSIGTAEVDCVCNELDSTAGNTIVARGNVTGVLRRAALWGAADTPVRFAAESATVTQGGEHLELEGEARLWQGDRMVRADQVAFERSSEQLNAVGKVVTLARMLPQGSSPGELVQLRARSLQYQHQAGVAVYDGDVELSDSRSITTCQRLTATMDDKGQVLLATLDGGVTITERVTTRVIKGHNARVDTAKNVMDVWGTPVVVQEPDGSQIKADHLVWRAATGTLEVFGTDQSPTETIYKPPTPGPTPAPTAAARQPSRKRRQ
jgi:lipopolysaccharide export system protein LptA